MAVDREGSVKYAIAGAAVLLAAAHFGLFKSRVQRQRENSSPEAIRQRTREAGTSTLSNGMVVTSPGILTTGKTTTGGPGEPRQEQPRLDFGFVSSSRILGIGR